MLKISKYIIFLTVAVAFSNASAADAVMGIHAKLVACPAKSELPEMCAEKWSACCVFIEPAAGEDNHETDKGQVEIYELDGEPMFSVETLVHE